jgi:AcrR family transcriptional regulator
MFTLSTWFVRSDVDDVNIDLHNVPMAKPRRYHHGDLRQTLLDGAVELIKNEGMRSFSLRRLAAQAGVSHAAPYRHFESKEEILATLMLEGHKRLRVDMMAAHKAARGKAADKLLAMGRTYLEFARQNSAYLSVMFSREGLAAAWSLREKFAFHAEDYDSFGVLESAVRDCQAEGVLDPDADVGAQSFLIWAEVHGLALLRNEGLVAGMSEMRGRSEAQVLDMMFKLMRARFRK